MNAIVMWQAAVRERVGGGRGQRHRGVRGTGDWGDGSPKLGGGQPKVRGCQPAFAHGRRAA